MKPEELNLSPDSLQQKQVELALSEKEIAWKQKLADVDTFEDGLGKGVDEGIKESVAAFLIHEFTTRQSCEGHLAEKEEKQHGHSYPWIEVQVPAPKGWREAGKEVQRQLEDKSRVENLEQQKRVLGFLEEFYKGRETPFDARLIIVGSERFGDFRVKSLGANITAILPPEERKQKLELYRKEMKDFTAFLKDKYLQSGETLTQVTSVVK